MGIWAQYTSKPTKFLLKSLHRVFGYLRGTGEHTLVFRKEKCSKVAYFCDYDYAGERDGRKSRTGWVGLMNGGAITWGSQKQHCTSLSTSEAEYVALSECCQEMKWLRLFLAEIGEKVSDPTILCNDNTGAEAWSNS